MISSVLTNFLNTYLCYYVDNLNSEQLKIGILSGRVDLTDLHLRKNIMSRLGLPLNIISGTIGRIYIEIPLSNLFSGNYVINISNVLLECELSHNIKYDDMNINVDLVEQTHSIFTQGRFMVGSLITNILNKFEIQLHKVSVTCNGVLTAQFESISCINLNSHKLAITNFAVHCHDQSVIHPCNALVTLNYEQTPHPLGKDTPRFNLDVQLREIELTINHQQILFIVDLIRQFKVCSQKIAFHKWRPDISVKENPRAWWKAVYGVIVDEIRNSKNKRKDSFDYVLMWETMLEIGSCTLEYENVKKRVESTLSYKEIISLRNLANERYNKSKNEDNSWMSSFFNKFKTSVRRTQLDEDEANALGNELMELLTTIKNDVDVLNKDAVFLRGLFKIDKISLTVSDYLHDSFCFNVDYISFFLQLEPQNDAFKLSGSLGTLDLTNNEQNRIIYSLGENDHFASFSFEVLPKNSPCDYRLSAKVMPFRFVPGLSYKLLNLIKFDLPYEDKNDIFVHNFERLQSAVKDNLWQLCHQFVESDERLKNKRWDIDLTINAPQLYINDSHGNVLLIVLGQLQVSNLGQNVEFSTPPEYRQCEDFCVSRNDFRDLIYDGYCVDLTGFQILAGSENSDWNNRNLHVLDRFNLSFILKRRIISIVDESWPKLIIDGNLDELVLHFDTTKLAIITTSIKQFNMNFETHLPEPTFVKEFGGNLINCTFNISKVDVNMQIVDGSSLKLLLNDIHAQLICSTKTNKINFKMSNVDIMENEEWLVSSHYDLSGRGGMGNGNPVIRVSVCLVDGVVVASCRFNELCVIGKFVETRIEKFLSKLSKFKLAVPNNETTCATPISLNASFSQLTFVSFNVIRLHNADADISINGDNFQLESYLTHIQLLSHVLIAEIGCDDKTSKAIRCSFSSGTCCGKSVQDINIKITSLCYLHSSQFIDNIWKYRTDQSYKSSYNVLDNVNLYFEVENPTIILNNKSDYFSVHFGGIVLKTGSFLHGEVGPSKNLLNVKEYLTINSRITPISHIYVTDLSVRHFISNSSNVVENYFDSFPNKTSILDKVKLELCVLFLSSTKTQLDIDDELYGQHISQKILLNISVIEPIIFNFDKHTLQMLTSCFTKSTLSTIPQSYYKNIGMADIMTLSSFVVAFEVDSIQFKLYEDRMSREILKITLDDINGLCIPLTSYIYGLKIHCGLLNIAEQAKSGILMTSSLRKQGDIYENHSVVFEVVSNNNLCNVYLRLQYLSIVLNLDTWIFLCDFIPSSENEGSKSVKETSFYISIGQLVLGLCKPDYLLTEIVMTSLNVHGEENNSHKLIDFNIGKLNIKDMADSHGKYRDKLVGHESKPILIQYITDKQNPHNREECCFKLKTSNIKILYIHCFFMEIISFVDNFTKSIKSTVEKESKCTKLEVDLFDTHLFIPASWQSDEVLVGRIAKVSLRNAYENVPVESNNSTLLQMMNNNILVDVIDIRLCEIMLFGVVRKAKSDTFYGDVIEFDDFVFEKYGNDIVDENFKLNLNIKRNLANDRHELPDWKFDGILSLIEFNISRFQYALIRGLISNNFGYQFNFDLTDNSKLCWITKSLNLSLSNIIINIYDNQALAQFNLIRSLLSYTKYSDGRSEVNLHSYEIVGQDSRPNCNVHKTVLSSSIESNNNANQLEINYSSFDGENILKLIFQSVRIFGISDFIMDVTTFLLSQPLGCYLTDQHDSFTLVLNFGDTEFIFLENCSLSDSNALVIKGDMLFQKQDYNMEQPLFCNLENVELFSTVISRMEETTISIIEPFKFNLDINRPLHSSSSNKILKSTNIDVFCDRIKLNISHNDVSLIMTLFESIPSNLRNAVGSSTPNDDSQFKLVRNINLFFDSISIMVIDDYVHVPLVELSLTNLTSSFVLGDGIDGVTSFHTFGVYYNRFMCTWEYFIEPLKLRIQHKLIDNVKIEIESNTPLNMNITKSMLDMYRTTTKSGVLSRTSKYRNAFTPYIIKNDIGMPIYFQVVAAQNDFPCQNNGDIVFEGVSPWVEVLPSYSADFTAEQSKNVNEFQLRRIQIRIGPSPILKPIPIDTVGVFLRDVVCDSLNGRISATVTQQGTKKSILITSTLVIANNLKNNVQLMIDGMHMLSGRDIVVESGEIYHVPLNFVNSNMSIKVMTHGMLRFYKVPVCWFDVAEKESVCCTINCKTTNGDVYRYILSIINLGYPRQLPFDQNRPEKPVVGHLIALYPLFVVRNYTLLPLIFHYSDGRKLNTSIQSNEDIHLHSIIGNELSFGFIYDGFKSSDQLKINSDTTSYNCPINMYDCNHNPLALDATIHRYLRGFVEIKVTSPYYFVNMTDIALIIKDAEADIVYAGQQLKPWPFYMNKSDYQNNLKIGHRFSSGELIWSDPFPVECASFVRRIMNPSTSECYTVGIDVCPGQQKQAHCKIVNVSAHIVMKNLLEYNICAFIKDYKSKVINSKEESPLHWWMFENEKYLSIQILGDNPSKVSGMIQVNKIDSFQIILRHEKNSLACYYVSVDVAYYCGCYCVIISGGDKSLMPYCIENNLNLTVNFHQNNEYHSLQPHSSYSYALDDPLGAHSLEFSVLDCHQCIDLNKTGNVCLFLNQMFYISSEFGKVLEYNNGNYIVLSDKQIGNKRQLWKCDRNGRIYIDNSYLSVSKSRGHWRLCITTNKQFNWNFNDNGLLKCKGMSVSVIDDMVVLDKQTNHTFYKHNMWCNADWVTFSVWDEGVTRHVTVDNVAHEFRKTDTLQYTIQFNMGIGISLINHVPEELVYIRLNNISVAFNSNGGVYDLTINVSQLQIDDQLRQVKDSVILYFKKCNLPNLSFSCRYTSRPGIVVFEDFDIKIQKLYFILEERVLWKIIQFLSSQESVSGSETKLFFRRLHFSLEKLLLSVHKATLDDDLKAIKNSCGVKLINFDNAKIALNPFIRRNVFRRLDRLHNEILNHYKDDMAKHAAKIFGYVDFLGSPLGLVNDLVSGVADLTEGNVEGFIKSVTHGVSNSAAKFTKSLSETVAPTTLDSEHSFSRKQVMHSQRRSTVDHISAGVQSFGLGFWSGLTSLPSSVYRGAVKEGAKGVVKGLVKGAIGTVTKPIVGTLDLASGVASAVEATSSLSSDTMPKPMRRPRCCRGPILSSFSDSSALGQEILCCITRQSEKFIAMENISRDNSWNHLLILSNLSVHLVKCYESNGLVVSTDTAVTIPYSDIMSLRTAHYGRQYSVEINVSHQTSSRNVYVACANLSCASKLCHWISFAKAQYEEENEGFTVDEYII